MHKTCKVRKFLVGKAMITGLPEDDSRQTTR
jgi:hypothetical protein